MSVDDHSKVERDPLLSALDKADEIHSAMEQKEDGLRGRVGGRDGVLLELRPAWRLAVEEHQLCMDILEIHEGHGGRALPLDVQRIAEMTTQEALHRRTIAAIGGTNAVAECIFALPARTLDGVLFKRDVLHNFGRGDRPAFNDSLSDDLLAYAEAQERIVAA